LSGLNDILKEIGLNPIKVQGGVSIDTTELIEALFVEIAKRCAQGKRIHIKNFGTFEARKHKGRTLHTPLVEGGEVTYGDMMLLKFKQAGKSKRLMNGGAAKVGEDKPKKEKKNKKTKKKNTAVKTKTKAKKSKKSNI
jgi:nucleoid DNA-binding protein